MPSDAPSTDARHWRRHSSADTPAASGHRRGPPTPGNRDPRAPVDPRALPALATERRRPRNLPTTSTSRADGDSAGDSGSRSRAEPRSPASSCSRSPPTATSETSKPQSGASRSAAFSRSRSARRRVIHLRGEHLEHGAQGPAREPRYRARRRPWSRWPRVLRSAATATKVSPHSAALRLSALASRTGRRDALRYCRCSARRGPLQREASLKTSSLAAVVPARGRQARRCRSSARSDRLPRAARNTARGAARQVRGRTPGRGAYEYPDSYDVIVVGAGHAGCEAALAAARMGARVLVLTGNLDDGRADVVQPGDRRRRQGPPRQGDRRARRRDGERHRRHRHPVPPAQHEQGPGGALDARAGRQAPLPRRDADAARERSRALALRQGEVAEAARRRSDRAARVVVGVDDHDRRDLSARAPYPHHRHLPARRDPRRRGAGAGGRAGEAPRDRPLATRSPRSASARAPQDRHAVPRSIADDRLRGPRAPAGRRSAAAFRFAAARMPPLPQLAAGSPTRTRARTTIIRDDLPRSPMYRKAASRAAGRATARASRTRSSASPTRTATRSSSSPRASTRARSTRTASRPGCRSTSSSRSSARSPASSAPR